ncbi:MAG TPA: type II secretion system F family protein [Kiloniellaceae bacterium]|nr:type II secretion system F family protein [Kiloniellaceae bacterium]
MNWINTLLSGDAAAENLVIWGLPAVIGVVLVVVAFLLGDDSEERWKRRVKRVQDFRQRKGPLTPEQAISIRRKTQDSSIPLFDLMIKRFLPRPDVLRQRITKAGLHISLGTYLSICIGIFAIVTTAMALLEVIPNLAAPLIGLFLGVGIPHIVVGILAKRRHGKFISLFPEAIDLMVRGLKSGLPINESMKAAGNEIADPVGYEFRQITDQVRVGTKLEEAMQDAGKRLNIQEFNFMNIAMNIQSETGGNLAETLNNLSDVLRKRRQLKLKVKALSSEAKASAYIIGSLPFIMTGLIYMTNEHYIMTLFTDPRGNLMVLGGLLWFAIGAGVMFKMVRFEA